MKLFLASLISYLLPFFRVNAPFSCVNKHRVLLFVFYFLFGSGGDIYGQIDSLKKELQVHKSNKVQTVKLYNQLARAYWGEQWDSAASYADRAYTLAQALKSQEDIAHALVKQAVVKAERGQMSQALELFKQSESIARKHDYQPIVAEIYDHVGILYQQQNQNDSAAHYYRKSIALCEALGLESHVLRIKNNLGYILKRQNRHYELAMMYDSIIPRLEQTKSYTNLARTYSYMALNFKDMYDQSKALLYTDKAVALLDSIDHTETRALIYYNAGGTYQHYQMYAQAEQLLEKSLALVKQANDSYKIETVQANLAEVYMAYRQDYPRAQVLIDETITQTKNPHILRLKGQILSHQQHYAASNHFLERALEIYQQREDESSMKQIWSFKIKNQLLASGKPEIWKSFEAFDSLNVRVNESENKKQFIQMETKFRTAEKELEIQKKETALIEAKQKMLLLSGLAILLLIVSLFTVWYLRNQQRRKTLQQENELLALQNNLSTLELANLNNQLNPHEVKNLLTSFAPDLLRQAPDVYKKMIKLFNITRASLSQQLTESLQVQLTQIEDYLSLQQSISPYLWEFEIDNQVGDIRIELPRLLLKNMVENAVKHGMKSRPTGRGLIRVEITQNHEQYLEIRVADNGQVNPQVDEHSTGVGFATYQKLFAFTNAFNRQFASLDFRRTDYWTEVLIKVPLHYIYWKA